MKTISNLTALNAAQSYLKPAVLLFFLAPLFGEYLLGNLKLSELIYVPFIAPLYGAGALLIREFARRAGRGAGTMLILGVAYGLIEEGLVDQMLFNQSYSTGQEQISNTYIPILGMDAWLTLIVLAMHAIWSTYIPITLVEALFPQWETTPWLNGKDLASVVGIFVLGSIYLCYTISREENFFASGPQLIGASVGVVVLIMVAFSNWSRMRAQTLAGSFLPNPWLAGMFSLMASSLYMSTEMLPGWTKVGGALLLLIIFVAMVYHWSHHKDWSATHRLALVGGAILTYAWLGIFMEPESGPKTIFDHIGSCIFALGAIGLFGMAVTKRRKHEKITRTTFADRISQNG